MVDRKKSVELMRTSHEDPEYFDDDDYDTFLCYIVCNIEAHSLLSMGLPYFRPVFSWLIPSSP